MDEVHIGFECDCAKPSRSNSVQVLNMEKIHVVGNLTRHKATGPQATVHVSAHDMEVAYFSRRSL